jgi:hypothetical protein
MPHDYVVGTHLYVTARGREVPHAEVRRTIERLLAVVGSRARRLGERFNRGEITVDEFHAGMRELLRSGHIVAYSIGRGGRKRMSQADWTRVGAKLKSEYGYLRKLAAKLASGKVAKAITAHRAQKYAAGIWTSYHNAFAGEHNKSGILVRRILNAKESCEGCLRIARKGWITPREMPDLGTQECGNFCKCYFEFSDDYERETGIKVSPGGQA